MTATDEVDVAMPNLTTSEFFFKMLDMWKPKFVSNMAHLIPVYERNLEFYRSENIPDLLEKIVGGNRYIMADIICILGSLTLKGYGNLFNKNRYIIILAELRYKYEEIFTNKILETRYVKFMDTMAFHKIKDSHHNVDSIETWETWMCGSAADVFYTNSVKAANLALRERIIEDRKKLYG